MSFKEIWNQAKQKIYDTIDKGNSEIKKYGATIRMSIYSRPILGGFLTRQVFFEEDGILMLTTDLKEDDIGLNSIIGIENDDELYVVTRISDDEEIKELKQEQKTYQYPCHKIQYRSLNDVFTEQTMGFAYHEMSSSQQEILNKIKKELENKTFAVKEKKEICFRLCQYFTECIAYRLPDHYVMHAFVKIADDYIEDFSSLLLKLCV